MALQWPLMPDGIPTTRRLTAEESRARSFHLRFRTRPGRTGLRASLLASVLLSTSLGCAGAQSGGAPVPVDQDTAPAPYWKNPKPLAGIPAGQALNWPSLAFWRETLFIAGNITPTGVDGPEPVRSQPLLVLRAPGGSIGKPEGQFTFMFPRGVFAGDGRYHLFWGEPDSVPQSTYPEHWPPTAVRSVWHATYAGTWSQPERLLNEFHVSWGFRGDVVTVDQSGRIHLALVVLHARGGPALAYLRSSGSSWERTDTRIGLGNSGSVLTWRRDSLAIAYVGFPSDTSRERARVRLILSGDGGSTWSEPAHPPLSGRDPDSPLMSRSADGVLHVMWREFARGGGASSGQEFRSWESADGGATWRDGGAFLVPSFGSFVVVPGLCSGSALVADVSDGETIWLEQLVFGEHSLSRRLFPRQWLNSDAGMTVHGDKLVIAWSSIRTLPERLSAWVAEADACGRDMAAVGEGH
jgi:hypothetical protein